METEGNKSNNGYLDRRDLGGGSLRVCMSPGQGQGPAV